MIDRERIANRQRIGKRLLQWHYEEAPHIKRLGFDGENEEARRLQGKFGNTRVQTSKRRKYGKDAMTLQERKFEEAWPWYDF
ncbi:hypothetical protein JCM16814_20570 [Desulfobaculum senezii]|jgi:hypothetical protein